MSNHTTIKSPVEGQKSHIQALRDELTIEEQSLVEKVRKFNYSTIEECAQVDPLLLELEHEDTSVFIDLQKQCEHLTQKKKDLTRTIYIEPARRTEILEEVEQLLINNRDIGVYQRSGKLVRVVPTHSSCHKKRISYRVEEINQISLSLLLDKIGIFRKYDARSGTIKNIDFPEIIARFFLEKGMWSLPILNGISYTPTLRSDASIVNMPGYDEQSRIIFHYDLEIFKAIPEYPTKEDALKALDQIKYILEEFPFEDEVSRSVAIAAIVTAVNRKALSTAPLFGFSAPKMGTGKSLLADIVSLIAIGMPNSAIPQASNETEEKKRILSLLMKGDTIIMYDNIDRPFGGSALCSVLSQLEYQDRLLGINETRQVSTSATFLATGNNLTFLGEISTRVVQCKLDSYEERPEERSFKLNLHKYIPEHRADLVNATLIILRAYHVAGRPPHKRAPFGRFEEWDSLVRGSLLWLGMEDPCESRKGIEVEDPVRIMLSTLFHAWFTLFASHPVKVKQLITEAAQGSDEVHENLHNAMLELAEDKGGINPRILAKKLSSFKGRIEVGYRLELVGRLQGTTQWSMKKIEKR